MDTVQAEPFLKATVDPLPVPESKSDQVEAQYRAVLDGARKVLELAYFEGLSCAEISTRVAAPIGTVKSRVAAGLGKLRVSLGARRGGEVV